MLNKLKAALARAYRIAKTKVWYALLLIFPFTDQIMAYLMPYTPRMLQHGGIYKWMGYSIVAFNSARQTYALILQFRAARAAADAATGG